MESTPMNAPSGQSAPQPQRKLAKHVCQVPEHVMEAIREADEIAEELDDIGGELESLAEHIPNDDDADLTPQMARAFRYAARLSGLFARERALEEFEYLRSVEGGMEVESQFLNIGWVQDAVLIAADALAKKDTVEKVTGLLYTCEYVCRAVYGKVRTVLASLGFGDLPEGVALPSSLPSVCNEEAKASISWKYVEEETGHAYEAVVEPIQGQSYALGALSFMIAPASTSHCHLDIFLGADFDPEMNILEVDLPTLEGCQRFAQEFLSLLLLPLSQG